MDLVLLILAASKQPMLASEIAPLLARDGNAVRATLSLLAREGLATKQLAGAKGPIGTYKWAATESGKACVSHLRLWLSTQWGQA